MGEKVTDMNSMFYGATDFNQPIEAWDVGQVTDMEDMFSWAADFNQPLDSWNVNAATNMRGMFMNATAFNQPLEAWNTEKVTLSMRPNTKGSLHSRERDGRRLAGHASLANAVTAGDRP